MGEQRNQEQQPQTSLQQPIKDEDRMTKSGGHLPPHPVFPMRNPSRVNVFFLFKKSECFWK